MTIYKLKDDDIEHEYRTEHASHWGQVAWAAVCTFGILLPVIVFAGMMFDFW